MLEFVLGITIIKAGSMFTLRPGFLPIRKQPIHMSVSNIWLQVCAMKSLCFAATASFRQVELLQLTSSYVRSFMATCSSCLYDWSNNS